MPAAKQSAAPVKSQVPRPRGFDAEATTALRLVEDNQQLPPRLWAAWVGRLLGIQVNRPCYSASGEVVGFGTENGGEAYSRPIAYLRPSEIAVKIHRLIGTPSEICALKVLSDMVQWLDSQTQRNFCFEAVGMLARDDEQEPPGRVIIQQAIRKLAVKQTLLELESPPARQALIRAKQSALLTEPPEVFQQKLDDLQRHGPLEGFFDEGEAA